MPPTIAQGSANIATCHSVLLFNLKEPAHAATWRGAVIDQRFKGEKNKLHDKPCFGHFIGVADLLDLLMDIEQKIITQLESA